MKLLDASFRLLWRQIIFAQNDERIIESKDNAKTNFNLFLIQQKVLRNYLIFYPKKTFAFYQSFMHAHIKLCTKVEAKKVLQAVQIFGSDIKPTNGN